MAESIEEPVDAVPALHDLGSEGEIQGPVAPLGFQFEGDTVSDQLPQPEREIVQGVDAWWFFRVVHKRPQDQNVSLPNTISGLQRSDIAVCVHDVLRLDMSSEQVVLDLQHRTTAPAELVACPGSYGDFLWSVPACAAIEDMLTSVTQFQALPAGGYDLQYELPNASAKQLVDVAQQLATSGALPGDNSWDAHHSP